MIGQSQIFVGAEEKREEEVGRERERERERERVGGERNEWGRRRRVGNVT